MRIALLALAVAAGVTSGQAQMLKPRAATSADSTPLTVADAEAQGARHPRAAPNNRLPPDAREHGTVDRKCADTGNQTIMRSGDFVAGPFSSYNELWHKGFGKLWWRPDFVVGPGKADALTVRVARLDGPSSPTVFMQTFLTHSVTPTGAPVTPDAYFYPSGIWLPSTGQWMLIVTAGPNWGCFVHTVN